MKFTRRTFGKRRHLLLPAANYDTAVSCVSLLPRLLLFPRQLEFVNIKVDITAILRWEQEYRTQTKSISRGSMRAHVAANSGAASQLPAARFHSRERVISRYERTIRGYQTRRRAYETLHNGKGQPISSSLRRTRRVRGMLTVRVGTVEKLFNDSTRRNVIRRRFIGFLRGARNFPALNLPATKQMENRPRRSIPITTLITDARPPQILHNVRFISIS